MRLNQYLARHTKLSRRAADAVISAGRVQINGAPASLGDFVTAADQVTLDNQIVESSTGITTIILHKPVGFVCSRNGQGSRTIYDLLPKNLHHLNPVGRLDKESSGLLLLTNDGELANRFTHPRYGKSKRYEVMLDKPLLQNHQNRISEKGIELEDGPSLLKLKSLDSSKRNWEVTMSEGRNRQIRRTFSALGYKVIKLHRTNIGDYYLKDLKEGDFADIISF